MPILGAARLTVRWRPRIDAALVAACAHWVLVTIAVASCVKGNGRTFQVFMLTLLVPAMRLAADPGYRWVCRSRLRQQWQRLADYADPGSPIPWRAVFSLVVFPTALLNLSTDRFLAGGDSWPVLATANSLITDGNPDISKHLHVADAAYIDKETGLPYFALRRGSHVYSSYPPGMVVFATPVCVAAKLAGANFSSNKVRIRLERFTAAWVGAACLGLFFLIAVRVENAIAAVVVTAFLATGSVMVSTVGHALWQHGGVIFWGLSALFLGAHFSGRKSARRSIFQGACLAMMLSCRPSSGAIVAVMLGWIGLRSMRHGFFAGLGVAIGLLPWAIIYQCVYGTIMGPTQAQAAAGNWGWSSEAVLGLLVSPGRGLFIFQPWLALAALLPLLRRTPAYDALVSAKAPSGWAWFCTVAIAVHFALIASWKCWWGGACVGSRLLSEIVPFAALLCLQPSQFLLRRRWGVVVLIVLGIVSAGLHYNAIHYPDVLSEKGSVTDWARFPLCFHH